MRPREVWHSPLVRARETAEALSAQLGWKAPLRVMAGLQPEDDPGDADTGRNNLQNDPVLSSAISAGGKLTVKGSLSSTPKTTFRVDLFATRRPTPPAMAKDRNATENAEDCGDGWDERC